MTKRKTPAEPPPDVHEEAWEDDSGVAVAEAPPASLPETEPSQEDTLAFDLPKKEKDFLAAVGDGAVKGAFVPRAALEASDWGELMGKAMKVAMERQPNAVQVQILSVERSHDGGYYSLKMRSKKTPPEVATIETQEWLHCMNHDLPKLGKWMRRIGNTLLGRDVSL